MFLFLINIFLLYFEKQNFITLTSIYLYKLLLNVFKYKNQLYEVNSTIHDYSTRQSAQLRSHKFNSTTYSRTPVCAGSRFFNNLPLSLKTINSFEIFKKHLKKFLIHGCFYDISEFLG